MAPCMRVVTKIRAIPLLLASQQSTSRYLENIKLLSAHTLRLIAAKNIRVNYSRIHLHVYRQSIIAPDIQSLLGHSIVTPAFYRYLGIPSLLEDYVCIHHSSGHSIIQLRHCFSRQLNQIACQLLCLNLIGCHCFAR